MLTEIQRTDIIAFRGHKSAKETAELMEFPVSERTVQRVWHEATKEGENDKPARMRNCVDVRQTSAKPDKTPLDTDVPIVGLYSISKDFTVDMMYTRLLDTKEQYELAKRRMELEPQDQSASYRAVQYNRQLIEMMQAMAKWIGIDKGTLTSAEDTQQKVDVKWI